MATTCTDERDLYADMKFCRGKKSLPGIRAYAYCIKKSNIVKWPTKADSDAADLAGIATLVGNFTLAADKKWNKLELIPDQNEVNSEPVGTYGSKMFTVTGTLVIPGTEEEATGFAAEANNDDLVYLIPERNGKFRLVGNKEFNTTTSAALASGKGSDDTNATTLTITVEDEIPAPFYPGTIETNDGDISGATGEAVATE